MRFIFCGKSIDFVADIKQAEFDIYNIVPTSTVLIITMVMKIERAI